MTVYRAKFQPGPFSLGAFSGIINVVAIAWVTFAIVLFAVPQVFPVNYLNLNYAPVAVGITLVLATSWWVLNARTWFKGPRFGWGHEDGDAEASMEGGSVGGAKDVDAPVAKDADVVAAKS
jgi:hypothetical protein